MGVWKKTTCNMCAQNCGIEMEIEHNEIVNVRPDPQNPRSMNYCCRKARAAKYYQHHSDRLNYPLKKVDGAFVRISWDQAISEIAEKLNGILAAHGPRSTALVGYALSSSLGEKPLAASWMALMGTQYYFNPAGLEFMGVFWSHGKAIGHQGHFTAPDEEHSDVFVLWGCNAYVSHQMRRARSTIREMSENPDQKLIVIDPRLSESARMADMHVMLRPGTDSLLIRALIALILKEGWQHQDYLDEHVKDFDAVKHWFTGIDIEKSLEVCGIPYATAYELGKIMTTKIWSLHQDLGIYMGRHNTLSSYLLIILMCVCGTFLVPGGTIVPDNFALNRSTNEDDPSVWRSTETNRFPVIATFPDGILPAEIMTEKEGRIRAVITSLSNPVRSFPDANAQEEAFRKLELLVCIDCCMTETAQLADYVLPGKTGYESHDFGVFQYSYPEVYCGLKRPVLEPVGERREDSDIVVAIADAMGIIPDIPDSLYDAANNKSRMEYFAELMAFMKENPSYMPGILMITAKTLGKAMGSTMKSTLWTAFMTNPNMPALTARAGFASVDDAFQAVLDHPEGVMVGLGDTTKTFDKITHEDKKVHLYLDVIDEYIKNITPEKEAADLLPTEEYPLIMSAGTHADGGVNGVMRNPQSYQHRNPCTFLMNPADGAKYGIKDGQLIQVSTKAGSVELYAEYTYRASAGYALMPHHYGFTAGGRTYGAAVNKLTSADHLDAITGNPIWRYVPCRVKAI